MRYNFNDYWASREAQKTGETEASPVDVATAVCCCLMGYFQNSNNHVGCIPCTIAIGAWNAPYDISLLMVNDVEMAGPKNLWPGTRVTRPTLKNDILQVFDRYCLYIQQVPF